MIRNADTAMYGAKEAGKARARTFGPAMHDAAVARLQFEAELREAITYQQFHLDFQPIVAIDDGHWIGLEALPRWQHPIRGLVMPNEFIPITEETRLIVPLGNWVLREACARLEQITTGGSGSHLGVAVNLSTRQMLDPGLVASVTAALASSRIDPSRLTLEITESVLIHDMPAALEQIRQLKSLGVRIALDDFGTGYSSLSYLRTLPVNVLKIDKSFVDGQPAEEALVRSILGLAAELGLAVVAEGVETVEQLDWLSGAGCQYAHPPVLAAALLSPG